jgi:hypothetical protein
MEDDKNNESIIFIECQHLVNKIEWILSDNKVEKFSDEEKEFLVKYIEISCDTLKKLINTEHADKIIFQNIKSERARTDVKMLMNQRLRTVTEELFQLPLVPDSNEEFTKRLKAAKLAVIEVSNVLPLPAPKKK